MDALGAKVFWQFICKPAITTAGKGSPAASSSETLDGKVLCRSCSKVYETKRAQSTAPVNKSEFAACHQSEHFDQTEEAAFAVQKHVVW